MGAATAPFADELNVFPYFLRSPHLGRLNHRVAGEGVFLGDAPRIDANKSLAAVIVLLAGPFFLFWRPMLMGNWRELVILLEIAGAGAAIIMVLL